MPPDGARRPGPPAALPLVLMAAALAAAASIAALDPGAAYADAGDGCAPGAGAECVYHVTRTLAVGDIIPSIAKVDDAGRVYVSNRPAPGGHGPELFAPAHLRQLRETTTG